jgi:hypothetical protein
MAKDLYTRCPYCNEPIKATALKCRFCKHLLYDQSLKLPEETKVSPPKMSQSRVYQSLPHNKKSIIAGVAAVTLIVIFIVIYFANEYGDFGNINTVSDDKTAETAIENIILDEPTQIYIYVDVPASSFLHLRSGPGTDYASLAHLKRGTELEQIGVAFEEYGLDGDIWLNVLTSNDQEGWVHSDYVASSL